ncbi:leucine-rich repeat receptor-like protein kinase PXC1 [Phalaenopsis equestris]|uniref:leucine-rich repeat receptor-like protein kinase PXC1 n=1 Tax=Phalaenopsis equestris TaxID=78828 RepID=UPI0009E1BA95|nr:leucine-rich repeat receptor-like protein kinase PXC1 [Phalaenopsis equestris]
MAPTFLPLLLLILPHLPSLPAMTDTEALTIFRHQADVHGILAANWSSPDACNGQWHGVSCSGDRVTSLLLPSLDLRGSLDSLSHVDQLRLLDLHSNRLNGTLLPLTSSLLKLKFLYLSGNDLSGEIPVSIGRLSRLLRIDLSNNDLHGFIPALGNLSRLLTLRLQNNLLAGRLPDLNVILPKLVQLNVSNNQLSGRVPDGVVEKFGLAAVAGNAGLCGLRGHLPLCSFIPHDSHPSVSSSPVSQPMVTSTASSIPHSHAGGERRERDGLSTGAIISIVIGNVALFSLLFLLLFAYYCCANHLGETEGKVDTEEGGIEDYKHSSCNSISNEEKRKKKEAGRNSDDGSGTEMESKLVFFDKTIGTGSRRGKKKAGRFELDELLRASAEMVGKGSIGTVYRAVLEDGEMVAVKRLKDANPCSFNDFNKYMNLIGRLSHPNLVPLRAYYYAKQEKLLIYDYLPNGTLSSLLHGKRDSGRVPLDWTTRVSLVLGAARGLCCIHEEYISSKIPHGNIKSSNILLDKNGRACISDFGLALLLNPAISAARLAGCTAPEQAESCKLSQEADVYAFGVLLLEVLTGRANGGGGVSSNLPEWVRSVVREEWTAEVFDVELMRYKNIEEEMVAMLHVALACVARRPEKRPVMAEVVRMIKEIRVEQSPLAGDDEEDGELSESRRTSASPSLPTTATEDARYSCALTE